MPRPIIEPAIGTLDGANTQFTTTATYAAGTVLVFLNGVLQKREQITELGGQAFAVGDPPEADDVLYVRYVTAV